VFGDLTSSSAGNQVGRGGLEGSRSHRQARHGGPALKAHHVLGRLPTSYWSRRWGGIHFQTGDMHGRTLGKVVGYDDWNKAQTYVNGTATSTA